MSCGLEMMSRVPLGANMQGGRPLPKTYFGRYTFNTQFLGAQLIAEEYGITREDTDRFGLRSQELAIAAWDAGHFDAEIIPIEAPIADEEGKPTGETQIVTRDGACARPRSRSSPRSSRCRARHCTRPAALAGLGWRCGPDPGLRGGRPAARRRAAGAHRLLDHHRRRSRHHAQGPDPGTQKVLKDTGLQIEQIDTYEVNEAFASIVLAWKKACNPVEERVNPQGGAIAIGHPTGGTGERLLTTALHKLERSGGRYGLVAMCCGGGLGTGTIIERV